MQSSIVFLMRTDRLYIWLHAAWVTSALLRDVRAWGGILAWISNYDTVQLETIMMGFVVQHGQDTYTDLGFMGYRGATYTGHTKGLIVCNTIEALCGLRTMLKLNNDEVHTFTTTFLCTKTLQTEDTR